jgi:siroheme synthase (precorrin-2 oxidase/ferrochelatase)
MQAVVRAGPARIGISTGGVAPRVGKILKERLQDALDGTFVRFLERLASLRRENRAKLADAPARRAAMLDAVAGFDVTVGVNYPGWFREELKDYDGIR